MAWSLFGTKCAVCGNRSLKVTIVPAGAAMGRVCVCKACATRLNGEIDARNRRAEEAGAKRRAAEATVTDLRLKEARAADKRRIEEFEAEHRERKRREAEALAELAARRRAEEAQLAAARFAVRAADKQREAEAAKRRDAEAAAQRLAEKAAVESRADDNRQAILNEIAMIKRNVDTFKDAQMLIIALKALGVEFESQDFMGMWLKSRNGRLGIFVKSSSINNEIFLLSYKPDGYRSICFVDEGKIQQLDLTNVLEIE